MVLTLPGYENITELAVGRHKRLWRALRKQNNLFVVIKAPRSEKDRYEASRLAYEFAALQHINREGARADVESALSLDPLDGDDHLVVRDACGPSLKDVTSIRALSVADVLSVGERLSAALAHVHRHGLIHKNLRPSNVIYDALTGNTQLIDFSIAAEIACERQVIPMSSGLESALPYLAPEQTGRLHRNIDARSDLYLLGVLLYELLYGAPPFADDDRQLLVYRIVAVPPVFPKSEKVPVHLQAILAALLEKEPDDRYQSAEALGADLTECARFLDGSSVCESFTPTLVRQRERFVVRQKLYGRKKEITALFTAFDAARAGYCQLAFLRGAAGIGKSSLIGELQAHTSEADVLMVMGKFEILQRGQPLLPLRQVLNGIARGILSGQNAKRDSWQRHLRHVAGHVGQVLVEISPMLESVIGQQRKLVDLPPRETENRLLSTMTRFLGGICERETLVLFLDDLQWADSATLRLIKTLLFEASAPRGLLLVGSYRDNEVPCDHPLALLQTEVHRCASRVHNIHLGPLSSDDILEMLEDAGGGRLPQARQLAHIISEERTGGNPMFVHEFIAGLGERGLLTYDLANLHWVCDLSTARLAELPENLAAMLTHKMSTLSKQSQTLLASAALSGNRFSLSDLIDGDVSHTMAWNAMRDATRLGVVAPIDRHYKYADSSGKDVRYRFLHDRLQHAALELLPPNEKLEVNLRLGLRRLANYQASPTDELLFTTLEQLCPAVELLVARMPAETETFIELNMKAAVLAKRSAAYHVALRYLGAVHQLLGPNGWRDHPRWSRSAALEQADCEYSSGNVNAALRVLDQVVKHSTTLAQVSEVGIRQINALTAAGRFEEALRAGLLTVEKLGMRLPYSPGNAYLAVSAADLVVQMAVKKLGSLKDRPAMTRDDIRGIVRIATGMGVAAFLVNENLYLFGILTVPRYTLRYGNSEASAYAFAMTGIFLCQVNRFKWGLRFTRLAREYQDSHPDALYPAAVDFCSKVFVEFVTMPPTRLLESLQECYILALDCGDPIFAAWASYQIPAAAAMLSLAEAMRLSEKYESFTTGKAQVHQRLSLKALKFLCTKLTVPSERIGDKFSAPEEAEFVREVEALGGTAAGHESIYRCIYAYTKGDWAGACLEAYRAVKHRVFQRIADSDLAYFAIWGLLAYETARRRKVYQRGMGPFLRWRMRQKLLAIAHAGAEHYGWHRDFLAMLEASRSGNTRAMLERGDAAVRALGRLGVRGVRAAVLEYLADALRHQGLAGPARHYLEQAHKAYGSWGATAKQAWMQQTMLLNPTSDSTESPHDRAPGIVFEDARSTPGDQMVEGLQDIVQASDLAALLVHAPKVLELISGATRGWLYLPFLNPRAIPITKDSEQASDPAEVLQMVARTGISHPDVATSQENSPGYLCLPALLSGRSVGSLYVENPRSTSLFEAPRKACLSAVLAAVVLAARRLQVESGIDHEVQRRLEADRSQQLGRLAAEREAIENQMAGGFAHEMRNALSGAAFALSAMGTSTSTSEVFDGTLAAEYERVASRFDHVPTVDEITAIRNQIKEHTETMRGLNEVVVSCITRGLAITDSILEYAQASSLIAADVSCNLGSVVAAVLQKRQDVLRKLNIEVTTRLTNVDTVHFTVEHASIVLTHLVDNAIDSMASLPPREARKLDITLQAEVGKRTCLYVSDTGRGITPEVASSLFKPFFSTKGTRGKGLGLALCRKLASVYSAGIEFCPGTGPGATFMLVMPAWREDLPSVVQHDAPGADTPS